MINVIIHCSDSSWGNACEITRWHLERGFSTIGYHYVILNGRLSPFKHHAYFNGYLETGRPLDDDKDLELDERGAHAFGYNDSVGICLIGLSGTFTDRQLWTLNHLIKRLREQFTEINIMQHSDVDSNKPHCAGLTRAQLNTLKL